MSFRWAASFTVGRCCEGGKGDMISSLRSAMAGRQSRGTRMLSMLRAGHTTTDWLPRSSRRRHSFSIGVWKPPITGVPASRMALAKS